MAVPRALILTGYGINCDKDTHHAFKTAGALPEIVHVNDLIDRRKALQDYQILAFPGGFSYGDDTGSGKALANRIRNNLLDEMLAFVTADKLAIGICNGFQVMTNLGLVPALDKKYGTAQVGLTYNTSGIYECRWVELRRDSDKCAFAHDDFTFMSVPVAHGEGKFVASPEVLKRLQDNGQIIFRYATLGQPALPANGAFPSNPNGSIDDIAGICDETGRIFGLMPHPERHVSPYQHPLWTAKNQVRLTESACTQPLRGEGDGLRVFKDAVSYFR